MNKKVDKISLGFENVEAIEIPRKYIYDLRISGVHTNANYDINYRNTFERHSLIADFAELTVDIPSCLMKKLLSAQKFLNTNNGKQNTLRCRGTENICNAYI